MDQYCLVICQGIPENFNYYKVPLEEIDDILRKDLIEVSKFMVNADDVSDNQMESFDRVDNKLVKWKKFMIKPEDMHKYSYTGAFVVSYLL